MARGYMIGGVRFYRRSLVKLSADERAALAASGRAALHLPVEWPLPDHTPDFSRAHTDRELDRARLAVLTDVLEWPSCSEPAILDHLRGPRPHVRGCWPVDLVLAKE